jgi:D-alanyl-D-alanine carboxypeptidase/D-alanyl-D-alanine-endopeptidase (penicillin-binding protein 4)
MMLATTLFAHRHLRQLLASTLAAFPMLLMTAPSQASDALSRALQMDRTSLIAEENGHPAISHQADRPMIPASTMKILTALAAIQRWGLQHHFQTEFLLAQDGWLWVKGYGDPYLVSQELDLIVRELQRKGIHSVAGIGTDDSYFASDVEISGRSSSDNPYDAPVTALAANFNTVDVARSGGEVRSSEAQTPVTPLARALAASHSGGRINLGKRDLALRYFGELLAAKLNEAGIAVGTGLRHGKVPNGAKPLYRHQNSRDLRAVLTAMLRYSNNFIANDLFLLLGDRGDGRPVSMPGAQSAAAAWATKTFGWHDFHIEDGAGLARENRLTARQLLDAVKSFAPYRDLLPEHGRQVMAKTGTLTGVSCYAGYVQRHGRWQPFSLMINQPVAHDFRLRVADALADAPSWSGLCDGRSC